MLSCNLFFTCSPLEEEKIPWVERPFAHGGTVRVHQIYLYPHMQHF